MLSVLRAYAVPLVVYPLEQAACAAFLNLHMILVHHIDRSLNCFLLHLNFNFLNNILFN